MFSVFFVIQVSKDVKKLREFEQNLVMYYKKYLDRLEEAVQGIGKFSLVIMMRRSALNKEKSSVIFQTIDHVPIM